MNITTILRNLGVESELQDTIEGPTVTQYALTLQAPTTVSKLERVQRDLAAALGQPEGVRILAPIPGTTWVGIETQTADRQVVDWNETFQLALDADTSDYALPIVLGVDTAGDAVVADLAKLPHLLVAGQTGSGKSVGLDAIIASLALGTDPKNVRLFLGDPKRVELSRWDSLPHVENPVATDHEAIAEMIRDLVTVMNKRYEVFEDAGVRNIVEYNASPEVQDFYDTDRDALPYHVLIVDEMADLLMGGQGKGIESDLVRLAQLARAAGIHMVLATQRPVKEVITGNLKANIPSRWAFNVASTTDSMVILDRPDAKKLYGQGDSLLLLAGRNEPVRVQAPYVSGDDLTSTIADVVEWHGETVDSSSLAASADDEVPADFAPEDDGHEEAWARSMELTNPDAVAARDAGRRKPTSAEALLTEEQAYTRDEVADQWAAALGRALNASPLSKPDFGPFEETNIKPFIEELRKDVDRVAKLDGRVLAQYADGSYGLVPDPGEVSALDRIPDPAGPQVIDHEAAEMDARKTAEVGAPNDRKEPAPHRGTRRWWRKLGDAVLYGVGTGVAAAVAYGVIENVVQAI